VASPFRICSRNLASCPLGDFIRLVPGRLRAPQIDQGSSHFVSYGYSSNDYVALFLRVGLKAICALIHDPYAELRGILAPLVNDALESQLSHEIIRSSSL
jgi:hypothetical protein